MHGSFDQPSQIAAVKYWEIIAVLRELVAFMLGVSFYLLRA